MQIIMLLLTSILVSTSVFAEEIKSITMDDTLTEEGWENYPTYDRDKYYSIGDFIPAMPDGKVYQNMRQISSIIDGYHPTDTMPDFILDLNSLDQSVDENDLRMKLSHLTNKVVEENQRIQILMANKNNLSVVIDPMKDLHQKLEGLTIFLEKFYNLETRQLAIMSNEPIRNMFELLVQNTMLLTRFINLGTGEYVLKNIVSIADLATMIDPVTSWLTISTSPKRLYNMETEQFKDMTSDFFDQWAKCCQIRDKAPALNVLAWYSPYLKIINSFAFYKDTVKSTFDEFNPSCGSIQIVWKLSNEEIQQNRMEVIYNLNKLRFGVFEDHGLKKAVIWLIPDSCLYDRQSRKEVLWRLNDYSILDIQGLIEITNSVMEKVPKIINDIQTVLKEQIIVYQNIKAQVSSFLDKEKEKLNGEMIKLNAWNNELLLKEQSISNEENILRAKQECFNLEFDKIVSDYKYCQDDVKQVYDNIITVQDKKIRILDEITGIYNREFISSETNNIDNLRDKIGFEQQRTIDKENAKLELYKLRKKLLELSDEKERLHSQKSKLRSKRSSVNFEKHELAKKWKSLKIRRFKYAEEFETYKKELGSVNELIKGNSNNSDKMQLLNIVSMK
jgi:hypothetical protein